MAHLLSAEDKAALKQLRELHDQMLIDEEEMKKLREPILDKLLKLQQTLPIPSRERGTPASAQLLSGSSPSSSDSVSPTLPAQQSASKTIHATLKAEVPAGKKLKRRHVPGPVNGCLQQQNSLFRFGISSAALLHLC
jgi:hypothetical protein